MLRFPEPIKDLIDYFDRLPGIGPKTAEKLVFYLLKQPKEYLKGFSEALQILHDTIQYCSTCMNFSQTEKCEICANKERDTGTICIVAENHDLAAIEHSGEYNGVYHVLGGTLNPLEGITPELLHIPQLLSRLEKTRVNEIIFAFNSDYEGEATVLYLQKLLKDKGINITRLAQGLPMGSVVEYADEVTLAKAIKGRTEI
ncbi:recombination protein RecR [candidate division KSB1 bacterium]|nr:MAG: recombination protein RecR [candidate division KSB1 bacterium]